VSSPLPEGRSVDIARVLHDARLGDLRTLTEPRAPFDALAAPSRRLFQELADRKIDYLLVGGMAMLQYVGGRNTRDIDVIIALPDLESLPGLIVLSHDGDFARADYDGVQVAALLVTNSLFRLVKAEFASRHLYGDVEIPTSTEEGLVVLKLFALPSLYRQSETARIGVYENDIFGLLSTGSVELDHVFAVLEQNLLVADVTELRRITADIEAAARPSPQAAVSGRLIYTAPTVNE